MKSGKISIILSCVLAVSALGAQDAAKKPVTVSGQEYNTAVNGIQEKHKVRYLVYKDAEIVKELKEYYTTEGLNQGQKNDILRRMARSAVNIKDDSATLKSVLAMVDTLEKQQDKNNVFSSIINDFCGNYSSQLQFDEAQKIAKDKLEAFDFNQKFYALSNLAWRSIKLENNTPKMNGYLESLLKLENPNSKNDSQKQQFEKQKNSSLTRITSAIAEYSLEDATKFFEKYASRFDDNAKCDVLFELGKGAVSSKERKAFDGILNQILASPISDNRMTALTRLVSTFAGAGGDGEAILLAEIGKNAKNSTPNQLFSAYNALAGLNRVNYFNNSFNVEGRYEKFMEYTEKALECAKAPDFKNIGLTANTYFPAARAALEFGDTAKAVRYITEALKHQPNNYNFKILAAEAMFNSDREAALKILDEIAANEKENINNRAFARSIIFFAKNGKCGDFAKTFADMKYTSAQQMTAMRRAGEFFFKTRDYAKARAISDWVVENMFRPVPDKKFTVVYDPDCPKTADGFVRSKYYNQWKQYETRFEVYGDGFGMDQRTDETWRLKDAKIPEVKDEFRNGVFLAYSDEGIHIFVHLLDPDINEVKLGKR